MTNDETTEQPGYAERDDDATTPQTGGSQEDGERIGQGEEGGHAHTPEGEHPAGDGERTDRDVGGPTPSE